MRFRGGSTTDSHSNYTNYTVAETAGPQLLVAWYGTYNGQLVTGSPTDGRDWDHEDTSQYLDGVVEVLDGPVVDIPNLLPGDSGTLSVGLFVDTEPARVWMRLRPHESISSELARALELTAWYDVGIFGIGGCQGAEEGAQVDPITAPGATLDDVGSLAEGAEINPGTLENSPIQSGQRVCLAFEWAFPTGVSNVLQGTTTSFDLEFVALEADNLINPFEGGD